MRASVDGAPVVMRYRLSGQSWLLEGTDTTTADTLHPRPDLSMRP